MKQFLIFILLFSILSNAQVLPDSIASKYKSASSPNKKREIMENYLMVKYRSKKVKVNDLLKQLDYFRK